MMDLIRLRSLDVTRSPHSNRPPYLSSASGLVIVGSRLYVIADDELALGCFTFNSTDPGFLLPLRAGELPENARERKRVKPDFEALALLPSTSTSATSAEDTRLLVVPSGSAENRRTGYLLGLASDGRTLRNNRPIDFTSLFARLSERFAELNIEGAAVHGDQLVLLQRGNGREARNGYICLDLNMAEQEMTTSGTLSSQGLRSITEPELGEIDGVPYSFTDLCVLPDGQLLFTAAAEATENTYEDGEIRGTLLGILTPQGQVAKTRALALKEKIEGVAALPSRNGLEIYFVNDADDPTKPSSLMSVTSRLDDLFFS